MPRLGKEHMLSRTITCPACGFIADMSSGLDIDAAPVPNDIGVCVECAEAFIFTPSLSLRVATQADFDSLHVFQLIQIKMAQASIRIMHQHRKKRSH